MGGAKNCPETPRQRMIGMMYLVLTAMLALNVSTDILKAFELVDQSLHTTMETTEARNKSTMHQFRMDSIDNPEKNGPWYIKTLELIEQSDSLYNYIQRFKYNIACRTDGESDVLKQIKKDSAIVTNPMDIRKLKGSDNRDVATHYALPDGDNKPGLELRRKIEAYREYLISLDTMKSEEFSMMFTTDTVTEEDGDRTPWEEQMFHDMPSGASLVLLTKLQNDIRNAESIMIQYLRGQADAGDLRVNKLNAYVIPKSRNVISGGKYEAQIILAAIDSTQTPEYYVEGQRINDQGLYEVAASSLGTKRYSGYILYLNPKTNSMEQLPFESEYSVMAPSVAVENTELNVMYSGHENKFSISVPGVPNDKISVSVNGASARQQGGLWIIKPGDNAKSVTISVSADIGDKKQSMGTKTYRVKPLPIPGAYLRAAGTEYASGSKVAYGKFKEAEIVASYGPDGLLEVPWKVQSFSATIGSRSYNSNGNKFTKEQLNQMSKLDRGTPIMISEIYAIGEGGVKKRLTSIVIQLQ